MRKRIELCDVIENVELPDEVKNAIEKNKILEFFDNNQIKEVENFFNEYSLGYQVAKLNLLGKEYAIIMKDNLLNAMVDPSAGDANILRDAGRYLNDKLVQAYGEKKLMPLDANIEQTIFKTYLNSLLMNLFKYPSDELNEEVLRELGLFDDDVKRLYANAVVVWLGSDKGIEKIIDGKNMVSKLDKITFIGKKEKCDLNLRICYSVSHYVLKPKLNTNQVDVQKNMPKIPEQYMDIENSIVAYVIKSSNEIVRDNARNLIRLLLNLTCLYDANKPLPLEWVG